MQLAEAKKILEAKKSKRDELKGKRDFLMSKFKELGFKTILQAKTERTKLEKASSTNQKEYTEMLEAFTSKWGKFL